MRIHIDQKAYGDNVILRDVSFDLEPGATMALMGPSGSGKSTLLRIIAGLDHQFSGAVERIEKQAMVFQEALLMNWRSALQNLTLMTGASECDSKSALEHVGLGGLEARLPQELSVGQQRRVSLARALVIEPELLILDEAFSSLDDETAGEMRLLVQDYIERSDCLCIMATHIQDDLPMAKRIFQIQDARLQEI